MSKNPYQSELGPDEGAFEAEYVQPPRTSILAIFSALLAIPCCIPGAGLLAAVLGGVSLGLIRNARGRLSGRVAAIIGIFLGLFVTVLQVGLLIGAMQAYAFWSHSMAPAVSQLVVSAAQGDYATARGALTPDADADLTDEQLALLLTVIEKEAGSVQKIETRLQDIFTAFGRTYHGGASGQVNAGQTSGAGVTPVPFAIVGANETLLCWALFDDDSLGKGKTVRIVDFLVMLPGGKAIPMREDAEAADMASIMSAQLLTPQEALDEANSVDEIPTDETSIDVDPNTDGPTPAATPD